MSNALLLLCLFTTFGLEITKIPSTDTPPRELVNSAIAYDESQNRMIVFGGFDPQLNEYLYNTYSFSLESLTWAEIIPESEFVPSGIAFTRTAIYNNILYVFYGRRAEGISANVYSFNLFTYVWKIEYIEGDNVSGRFNYAFTTFEYNNAVYAAIFGGFTNLGIDNSLFL